MKATKKIVGAACALVAAVALSAGSTFAWFTSNANVSVAKIEAKVVTKGGDLQIGLVKYKESDSAVDYTSIYQVVDTDSGSVDSYKYTLTNPFAVDGEGLAEGYELDAVTTADGKAFTTQEGTTVEASAKNFIQFTISLRSTTNMLVYLDTSSLVSTKAATGTTAIAAWTTIADGTYGNVGAISAGTAIPAKAQDAARVSFTAVDSVTDTQVCYWAPWESTTNGGVLTEAEIDALEEAPKAQYGFYKGNLASDYAVNNGKSAVTAADLSSYKIVSPLAADVSDSIITDTLANLKSGENAGSIICQLAAGTAQSITINMWLEGTDGDCFNSIFSDTVSLTLAFYGVDIEAVTTP